MSQQHLDSDGPVQDLVAALPNLGHAAPGHQPHKAVPSRESPWHTGCYTCHAKPGYRFTAPSSRASDRQTISRGTGALRLAGPRHSDRAPAGMRGDHRPDVAHHAALRRGHVRQELDEAAKIRGIRVH